MPTYVYKFTETGETIEVQQAFTDPTLTELAHPADGVVRAVKKVFQPVGITFKGSGFYKTDNRGKSSGSSTASTSKADSATGDTGSASASSSSDSSAASASSASSTPSSSSTPASGTASSSS